MNIAEATQGQIGSDARPSSRTPGNVPYYVRACALGISAYLIGVHLWTWVWNVKAFLAGQADFRRLYASSYMVRAGYAHLLYDISARFLIENRIVGPGASLGFDHPAYEALLYLPFSYFRYRTAYFLFLSLNVGLLAVTFWILKPWMRNLRHVYWWLPVAMFLAFLPVCAALIQGQDSILLLLLIAVAFRCLDHDHELLAGLVLGLGFFKFNVVVPIAALFLFWKRWRFVSGFIATAGAAMVGSIALVGIRQNLLYLQTLAGMSLYSGSAAERSKFFLIPTSMPNIRGLIFGILSSRLSNSWIQELTILFSAVLFAWAAIGTKGRESGRRMLVAILVAGLVSYHFLIHDMVVLLVPVLVTIDAFLFAEPNGDRDEIAKLRAAALLFAAPVLMGWFPGHFYLAALPIFVLAILLAKREMPNVKLPGFASNFAGKH